MFESFWESVHIMMYKIDWHSLFTTKLYIILHVTINMHNCWNSFSKQNFTKQIIWINLPHTANSEHKIYYFYVSSQMGSSKMGEKSLDDIVKKFASFMSWIWKVFFIYEFHREWKRCWTIFIIRKFCSNRIVIWLGLHWVSY